MHPLSKLYLSAIFCCASLAYTQDTAPEEFVDELFPLEHLQPIDLPADVDTIEIYQPVFYVSEQEEDATLLMHDEPLMLEDLMPQNNELQEELALQELFEIVNDMVPGQEIITVEEPPAIIIEQESQEAQEQATLSPAEQVPHELINVVKAKQKAKLEKRKRKADKKINKKTTKQKTKDGIVSRINCPI
jgi:hypothetical protein